MWEPQKRERFQQLRQRQGVLTEAEQAELTFLEQELEAAEAFYLSSSTEWLRQERQTLENQNRTLEVLARRKEALVFRLRDFLWHLPRTGWTRFLGNVEGWAALICTVAVLTAQTTPAARYNIPWLWMTLWATGIGAGIGGIRFGGPSGKLVGGIAVVLLGLALIALLLSCFVRGFD